MSVAWQGVYPAVTTQFHPDQGLDIPATMAHLDRLIGRRPARPDHAGHGRRELLARVCRKAGAAAGDRRARRRPRAGPFRRGRIHDALACRFANDAEKIGVDGLMVLPALVYKSDPRETMAHFRTVARSTGLNRDGL